MKLNNLTIILCLLILVLPLVISETNTQNINDVFKVNQEVNYVKPCFYNGTYCSSLASCNSTVFFPNNTILVNDSLMTNQINRHNITFTPTTKGIYKTDMVCCDQGTCNSGTFYFEVTGTGTQVNLTSGVMYFVFLLLLVFFFGITLYAIPQLPSGNNTDDYGLILSINHLKYLRPVLYIIAWSLLLAILFVSTSISQVYMGSNPFESLLFTLYTIMFIATLPMVIIWVLFLFVQIFSDNEMKKMIERGVDIKTP